MLYQLQSPIDNNGKSINNQYVFKRNEKKENDCLRLSA